jgi:hypothetical protein
VNCVILSRFKFITSKNPSKSIPIHFNPHETEITEQGLRVDLVDKDTRGFIGEESLC